MPSTMMQRFSNSFNESPGADESDSPFFVFLPDTTGSSKLLAASF